MRQIRREIRAKIRRPVFSQAASHIHTRILLGGELDVWIGLVVAQQDVVARLPLLDQVVLKGQRFLLVVNLYVVDVARGGDQRARLRIGHAVVVEIAAYAAAEVL